MAFLGADADADAGVDSGAGAGVDSGAGAQRAAPSSDCRATRF
jgi:hypothetical protein